MSTGTRRGPFRSSRATRRTVLILDLLLMAFAAVLLVIVETGGGTLRIAGLRITTDTVWRPLLMMGGLLLLRLVVDRRAGPFGRTSAELRQGLGLAESASHTSGPMPGWREILAITLGLMVATGLVLHRQLADVYGVPDIGDPLFSMWRIGWVAHQVLENPVHLFDANIFHPEQGTLTYSDSMLLPALIAAPLVWLGVPIAILYTILFLSAWVVSGVATYLFARVVHLSRGASWIAALTFALCQYRFEHYSHLELQMAQWMPLTLLAAHRLLASGRRRYFVFLALALGAQWYSSMYYGIFLSIFAGVFVCVLALAWRPGWRRFAAAAVALAVGVGLALPLARVYKSTESVRGIRDADIVETYSATPVDYLRPNPRSVYRQWSPFARVAERELFPHAVPIVLAVAGAFPPLSATTLALLSAGAVAFDGSLGFNGHWYRTAYDQLDPLKSMRVPARFAILVNFTLAMLAGMGAARLAARARSLTLRRFVIVILTTLFLVESLPVLSLRPVWKEPPALYAALGPDSNAVLFEYPIRPNSIGDNFPYLYFSTWHWTPTVNGYSGFVPSSFEDLALRTAGFPLGNTVGYLQQRGVTHVTVHCALWSEDACTVTRQRLDADPRFRLVVSTTWQQQPACLYELSREPVTDAAAAAGR